MPVQFRTHSLQNTYQKKGQDNWYVMHCNNNMNSPMKNNLSIHNWPEFIISSSGSLHWSAFIRLWQIPKWSSLQNRIKEILKVYSQRAKLFFEIRKLLWQKIMAKFNLCIVIDSLCKFLNRHCREFMVTNTQKPPDSN